jgi:hypothetical protein
MNASTMVLLCTLVEIDTRSPSCHPEGKPPIHGFLMMFTTRRSARRGTMLLGRADHDPVCAKIEPSAICQPSEMFRGTRS